jgi:Siphovirus Gp157
MHMKHRPALRPRTGFQECSKISGPSECYEHPPGPNHKSPRQGGKRGFEIEAEACKQEAKRLIERAAALENNSARLKKLILLALDGAFAGKVKTSLFTIWGQTSAPCISFDLTPGTDLATLPEACVRVTRSLATDAIKQMLKQGKALPEEIIVTEVPGTRYLRIR